MLRFSLLSTATVLTITGCVSLPNGPSVMVLPGTGISFEQFRGDDSFCQEFASSQAGESTANQEAISSRAASAVLSTVLGAAAGAAIGGERGAAIGAGTGLLMGGLFGSDAANTSMYAEQQHYDTAYVQCMYAKGHQVPVSGQFSREPPQRNVSPPAHIPAPPPGAPPAPPSK